MTTRGGRGGWSTLGVCAVAVMVLAAPAAASAKKSLPENLGNGLARLVDPPAMAHRPLGAGLRAQQGAVAIRDSLGRVLVDVRVAGPASITAVQARLRSLGMQVTARDSRYRTGMLEGFVAVDKVAAVATARGVSAVFQALPPRRSVGAVTSQGVEQERVDQLPRDVDGSGITVGALSDSFDDATTDLAGNPLTIHAADDVASGDLPGPGNPINQQPVVVLEDLQDDPDSTDEGRGMLQIVHDMAPKSKLCFATAFTGEVGFANNIRRLADPAQGCGADVEVDDVGYFSEPFFEDGIIANAVDEVAARGVHYFSSAGNSGAQQAYDAPISTVAADSPAVAASGLNLADVDPALFAAGFQDFDPGPGVDIAQSTTLFGSGLIDFQWDDPFDPDGPELGASLLDVTGEITAAAPEARFQVNGQEGQLVLFNLDAIPSGTTDLILTLIGPDGQVIKEQDTGATPETIALALPATGTYTLVVTGFQGAVGDFTLKANEILSGTSVTSDFNLLFFDGDGNFLAAASDNNLFSGRPTEVFAAAADGLPVQVVIARAAAPAAGAPSATHLRYIMNGDWKVEEWRQPTAPATFGHPTARGATGVGAYSPFTPEVPEWFTSPGGELEFPFDADGNRLAQPDVRRKPEVSGIDGGNTTFFGGDTTRDPDAFPNFFGTSASAPHVASIAALVLDRRGGGNSVTPTAMRNLLQRSTFAHDLDQYQARASGGGVSIQANAEYGSELNLFTASQTDPNTFVVRYSGPGSVTQLTLDAEEGNPTGFPAGGSRGSLVWDPRPFDPAAPDLGGFPFTVGPASVGITPADVTASFSNPGRAPAVAGQFERMTIDIAPGKLAGGNVLAFGVDRDENPSAFGDAFEGNSADLLSDGVRSPQDRVARGQVEFTARLSTGGVVEGEFVNRVGLGWTPVDGFGLVDAVRAVGTTSRRAPSDANRATTARLPSKARAHRERRGRATDPR